MRPTITFKLNLNIQAMQSKVKKMKTQNWLLIAYLQEGSTLRTSFIHKDDEDGENSIEREFDLPMQQLEIESFGPDYDSPNYEYVFVEPTDEDYDLQSEIDLIVEHINEEMEGKDAA